jgi:hypothetical protein
MDLLSLDGGERYHTVAALVDIGRDKQPQFLLSGIFPDDRRERISRIMHEITHVGSIRTTRLGFWLARIATQLLGGNKLIPKGSINVAPVVEQVLGSLAPLLEGLALYGQLDYDTDNTDDILPFPLNKIAANNSGDSFVGGGVLHALRLARITTIWEGTLAALLLDDSPHTEHYFAGYMYIKALAAKLAGIAPELKQPATMLPLLVRLICDHPVIEQLATESILTPPNILDPILRFLHDLSEDSINRIARMLRHKEFRMAFDNWDIHAQLREADDGRVIKHANKNPLFEGMLENSLFAEFRGATSVHLTSWTSGIPVDLKFVDGYMSVQLIDGEQEISTHILYYSCLNAVLKKLDNRSTEALQKFEAYFHSRLAAACQSKVPIALGSYVTLTRGGAGMVLWVGDELAGVVPLSVLDNRLDPTEVNIAMDGLKLSPVFRQRFAHALSSSDSQASARAEADDAIMAAIISDRSWRTITLRGRLVAPLPLRLRGSLREWCGRALHPGAECHLDADADAALSSILDRPSLGGGPFSDLLPDLTPLDRFIRSRT